MLTLRALASIGNFDVSPTLYAATAVMVANSKAKAKVASKARLVQQAGTVAKAKAAKAAKMA